MGPIGSAIRTTFSRSDLPGADGMGALWNHNTSVIQSMAAAPDTHIIAKPGQQRKAQNLWDQRGRLLLPERVRLNTVRAISVRLNSLGLGSAWVPCKPMLAGINPDTLEKAICAYLNSSVGILAMLGNRSNKTPAYPRFSLDNLRRLRVPHFVGLGSGVIAQLAAVYDQCAHQVMLPLPQLNRCPARQALDAAVTDALGLETDLAADLRVRLSKEPSITGQRYPGAG